MNNITNTGSVGKAKSSDSPADEIPVERGSNNDTTSHAPKKTPPYVYHDYSRVPRDMGSSNTPCFTPQTPSSILRIQKLPTKLDVILSNPDYSHIIGWMPHGRSWKVLQPKVFLEEVVPLYFEYSNYNSFVRLVNAWGFRRISKGKDRNSYYHELFLKGMPHLHNRMKRLTAKEKKQPLSSDEEPDLDAISRANPLPSCEPMSRTSTHPTANGSEAANSISKQPSRMSHVVAPYAVPIQPMHSSDLANRTVPYAAPLNVATSQSQASSEHRLDLEGENQMLALSKAVQMVQRKQKEEELKKQESQLESLQRKIAKLQSSIATQRKALLEDAVEADASSTSRKTRKVSSEVLHDQTSQQLTLSGQANQQLCGTQPTLLRGPPPSSQAVAVSNAFQPCIGTLQVPTQILQEAQQLLQAQHFQQQLSPQILQALVHQYAAPSMSNQSQVSQSQANPQHAAGSLLLAAAVNLLTTGHGNVPQPVPQAPFSTTAPNQIIQNTQPHPNPNPHPHPQPQQQQQQQRQAQHPQQHQPKPGKRKNCGDE